MDERLTLREFQSRLADRLKVAVGKPGEAAKLGFTAGGRYWLIDLDQVSEMVSVTGFSRAPWVRPWFLGAVGVRGIIYGCTDLAAYLGLGEPAARDESRLLLAHARFGAHAALRIDQALGLRNPNAMHAAQPGADPPAWEIGCYADDDGVIWTEISIEKLMADPEFLQVSV